MKSKKCLLSIFVLVCMICQNLRAQELFVPAENAPKREVRAVWLTTLNGLDWPKNKATDEASRTKQKQELCQILDQLQRCGINTVLLQTRIRGAVIYPSKIEPWDVALTGIYDKDPGYDPLQYAIEETHRRGMELHAWVVTIPCFKIAVAKKIGKKSLLNTHPSLLHKHQESYYLDPGLPETADYLSLICQEIVKHYDVDGLHFDYIRYPEGASSFPDGTTFKKYGGKSKKEAWRRDNITRIVRKIHTDVKALKPWVRISCSPVGKYRDVSRFSAKGWAAYTTVHQDAQLWLKEGIMDMLCPMMYFEGDHFYPFAADWQENAYGRTIAPGLGIYFLHPKERDWEWGVVQRELCYLRQQGLQGQAYFRSKFLTDNTKGIYDYLRQTFYPHPALLPAMTWETGEQPQAPQITGRKRVDGTNEHLTWEAVEAGGQACRYAIYASRKTPVDTQDPANLVTLTWQPEYTYNLLSSTLYGLHLAVTAIDRFWNESEATPVE